MPYNGSGIFTRIYSWVNDAAANIKIRADRMDAEFNGIATGLTNCITKDGQTTVTANLPMAGYRHTGVGDALLSDQYTSLSQVTTSIAAITLDDLSGVVFTSLTSGDFIYYNGTNFVNVGKSVVPIDGIKATGASGVILKNSAGTAVITVGASAGTGAVFAGDVGVTGTLTANAALNTAKSANLASSSTVNIGAATGNFIHITGTTTITAFDTVAAGITRTVRFAGILTLTHNATSLILPSAANITTAANDTAVFVSEGSGNWRCVSYDRASGLPLVSPVSSIGDGQTWQSVTRTAGTTYTNSTGKPIMLLVQITMSGNNVTSFTQVSINSGSNIPITQCGGGAIPQTFSVGSIIIPTGATYVLTDQNLLTRLSWELR